MQQMVSMRSTIRPDNAATGMSAMRRPQGKPGCVIARRTADWKQFNWAQLARSVAAGCRIKPNPNFPHHALKIPPLRIGDQEIAERLNPRDRFELFRINKVGIDRDRVRFAE